MKISLCYSSGAAWNLEVSSTFLENLRVPVLDFFYVSLTVHLSITLATDQLNAQIFNTFITFLYMYIFRAISCSSSGGQTVLTLRLLMSYIYGAPILDVSRSHTTTQHSR